MRSSSMMSTPMAMITRSAYRVYGTVLFVLRNAVSEEEKRTNVVSDC
jgi:hypothetical protein